MKIENEISIIETEILINLAYANYWSLYKFPVNENDKTPDQLAREYLQKAKNLMEQKQKLLIESEEQIKRKITEFINDKCAKRYLQSKEDEYNP